MIAAALLPRTAPPRDDGERPATRRDVVVEMLRDAIVSGALAPGALLPEVELARRLGVSATPVREAIGQLAAEGLVEVEAHRLKRVAPIGLAAMRDLLTVQAQLWRLGYVWGMPHVGAAECTRLSAAVTAYGAALADGDMLRAIRAGHDFHSIVVIASGNRELLRFTLDRRALIARFILLQGCETISVLRQHERLRAALEERQHEAALALLDRLAARLVAMAERAV